MAVPEARNTASVLPSSSATSVPHRTPHSGTSWRCYRSGDHERYRLATARSARTRSVRAAAQQTDADALLPEHNLPPERQEIGSLRRHTLLALLLAALARDGTDKAARAQVDTPLRVGNGEAFRSISAALEAAEEGSTITIGSGLYKEQLLITKPVTIIADWESQQGSITVEWITTAPYESVVQSTASSCIIEGINFRHASPSVANNYAILNKGGSLRLQDCDVTSSTGSGVASEGGSLEFFGGSIHDCKGNGAALFADLEGKPCQAHLSGVTIARNGLQGILAREDSQVVVDNCDIIGNQQYGILLKDSEVEILASELSRNGKGNIKNQ